MNKDTNASDSPKVHIEIREVPSKTKECARPSAKWECRRQSPGRDVGFPFPWACQCWVDKDSSALGHTWDLAQGEQESLFCHHANTLGPASLGLGKAATFYDILPTHIHALPPLGVEGRRVDIPWWGNLGWGWQWSQGGGLEGRTVLAQGASGQRVGGQESILGRQGWGTGQTCRWAKTPSPVHAPLSHWTNFTYKIQVLTYNYQRITICNCRVLSRKYGALCSCSSLTPWTCPGSGKLTPWRANQEHSQPTVSKRPNHKLVNLMVKLLI